MKAMQLTDYDQPLVLRDIPVPTAEAGQVTVKIHTCGLNFGDLLIIKGTYQERPQLPFRWLPLKPTMKALVKIGSEPQ